MSTSWDSALDSDGISLGPSSSQGYPIWCAWRIHRLPRAIRVAVANQPRLMRELMVLTMIDQPDIEVVAEVQDEQEIARVVKETAPEFLIVSLKAPDIRESYCESLLRLCPDMKILALANDGNSFIFYSASLGVHATTLEGSEAGILSALRSNTRTEREM
jgi:DNA-binding NarL/FixJ family response regulator